MNQSISNSTWEPYDKKMDDIAVEETIMKKPHKRALSAEERKQLIKCIARWSKDVKAEGDKKD